MRKFKWTLFWLTLIFQIAPRIIYILKVLLPKELEETDNYKKYNGLAS
jgi:hypothetical protein